MRVTTIVIVILGFFIVPQSAAANVSVSVSGNNSESNVSVHQEGSNQVTTCINGKCETKGSSGKTTICKNGTCTTSEDGNFHYESEDGTAEIHVEDNSRTNQSQPTVTVGPESEKKIGEAKKKAEEARKKADEIRERVKERTKSEDAAISSFFKAQMEALQRLFEHLF